MTKPFWPFLPIWVIGLGLGCALLGVVFTMMTEDIWSAHTSQMSSLQLRDGLASVSQALKRLADATEQTTALSRSALQGIRDMTQALQDMKKQGGRK